MQTSFLIIASLIILGLVFFSEKGHSPTVIPLVIRPQDGKKLFLKTAVGTVSETDVEKTFYTPLGYKIIRHIEPIATVASINPQSCDQIFEDWLRIARENTSELAPPRDIPPELMEDYSMKGFAYIKNWYEDMKAASTPLKWDRAEIENLVSAPTVAYKHNAGEAIDYSTKYHSIEGMTGLVIGSLEPWVELVCLRNGAEKMIIAEYQNISSDHPQLRYLHPMEMAENWQNYYEAFDFAVSFSNLEHIGLGRYGDPIDPIGDLREMKKVRCQLKKGGLFFLGIPTGPDGVLFNAHRIYGRIRLPLMFEGYELINVFSSSYSLPYNLRNEPLEDPRNPLQPVFVLRKL